MEKGVGKTVLVFVSEKFVEITSLPVPFKTVQFFSKDKSEQPIKNKPIASVKQILFNKLFKIFIKFLVNKKKLKLKYFFSLYAFFLVSMSINFEYHILLIKKYEFLFCL